jgi:hypothetical protein
MKHLGLAIVAVLFSVTSAFAQSSDFKTGKEPFTVNTERLGSYLELTSMQKGKVEKINEFFIEMQKASLNVKQERQAKKMQHSVYSNLKLMKDVLTPEQYRKYVILLNITNNNNRLAMGVDTVSEIYLADKK